MFGEINVKVVIKDGIVEDVLVDETRLPINVEIVDIDEDYEDYDALRVYADEICDNPEYGRVYYTYADFKNE